MKFTTEPRRELMMYNIELDKKRYQDKLESKVNQILEEKRDVKAGNLLMF